MSLPICAASAFLGTRGPAVVPFQLCCALAVITAAGSEPPPFACGAVPADPSASLLWPGPDTEVPTISETAR